MNNYVHLSYQLQNVELFKNLSILNFQVALEELGADFNQDWKGFQQACIKALLKEAKEK